MRETSALYKLLRTQPGSWYETRVTRGNTSYGPDRLKSLTISPALFDGSGPSIGNTYSAKCKMTLVESTENWPRMAPFTVEIRLRSEDNAQAAEWLPMGTFYTDEREADKYGNLTVTAYDGMLLLEQTWIDKIPEAQLPTDWPITAKRVTELIKAATGADFDSRSDLDNTLAFIGLDTMRTARETLKDIAAAHGGNWVMSAGNQLRLLPLANLIDGSAAIAGLAIAGISIVGDGELNFYGNAAEIAYLGMSVMDLTEGAALPEVTGVQLESESGALSEAGNEGGYVLYGACEFSAEVAALALERTRGFSYRPFSVTGALLDPAAEVGDIVLIAGRNYQMASITWTLGAWVTADVGAAYEEEVDHEYTKEPESTKTLRKALTANKNLNTELRSYIQQTADSITADVGRTYESKTAAAEQYAELDSRITVAVGAVRSEVSSTYTSKTDFDRTIQELQDQIDNNITSYVGPSVPTLDNYPANEWEAEDERAQHVGNLYTVNQEGGEYAWFSYRFVESNGGYAWELITDTLAAQAIADAAKAQAAAEEAQRAADTARSEASKAQETADAATQAAEEAVNTAAADATEKAAAARVAAEQAAAADATAKALEAEAAARKSAAEDATDKMNRAITTANAYTDGKLESFILGDYAEAIRQLQEQMDGKAETFYQETDPSAGWDTRAGNAIAGIAVVGSTNGEHTGDLWYRTTDGTTWFWNGDKWIEQEAPQAVFDAIDGKAQIFISQPSPPYNIGDLWFNSASSDIMTCIVTRSIGSFVSSDWAKRNKYTDDTKANAVADDLAENYSTTLETKSLIEQAEDSVLLQVSQTYATQTEVARARNATITGEQIHYLATAAGTGVTTTTAGWTEEPQAVTAVKKYLWTYSTYTYGDEHTQDTVPAITGVYGDRGEQGPAGEDGAPGEKGDTGTGIYSTEPIYYVSNSQTAPSAPTNPVTTTVNGYNMWTKACPAVTATYPYLYYSDQVRYTDGSYKWTTPVANQAIQDLSTRMNAAELKITPSAIVSTVTSSDEFGNEVGSVVDQKADSIRLKADKLVWEATNSSMTEEGSLTCRDISLETTGYLRGKVQTTLGQFDVSYDPDTMADSFGEFVFTGLKISGVGNYYTPYSGDPSSVDETIIMVPGSSHTHAYGDGKYRVTSKIMSTGRLVLAAGGDGSIGNNKLTFDELDATLQHIGPEGGGYVIQLQNNIFRIGYTDPSGGAANFFTGTGSLSQGGASGTFNGYLTCYGGKSRVVRTKDYGERLLYCYEMPSPMFGDIGSGITDENGECYVSIDDIFGETSRLDIAYHVFLQEEGPGKLWVEEKTSSYFLVKGEPRLRFSWELKCKQLGFETERLDDYERREESLNNNGMLYSGVVPYMDTIDGYIRQQEELLQ